MLSVPQIDRLAPPAPSSIENTAGSGSTRSCTCRRASSSSMPVGVREQHDRLFGVIDDVVGEVRLIVEDQRDAVARRECRLR